MAAVTAGVGVYSGFAAGLPGDPGRRQVGWALLAAVAAGVLAYKGAVAGSDALRKRAPTPRQARRNRGLMLERVRTSWIHGVLDQSLESTTWIELGLRQRLDVVRPRAGLVAHRLDGEERVLPPGRSISAVFDEFGQALLVLGAPGSGKTTLLLELARELLNRAARDATHPIPVVFNLASWAVRRPALADWLVDELADVYDVSRGVGQDWVDTEQILPLLDGLDEVAPTHRDGCVEAINAFRQDHGFVPVVIASRTAEHALLTARLRLASAVEIQPLTRSQVDAHLTQVGEPLAGVRAALRDDPTLWELLESPLLLSIMALAYQGKRAAALPAAGTLRERRQQLFAAYTDAMFARRAEHPRYPKEKAAPWLAWLARSMRQHQLSEFYLERIQQDWLPTQARQRVFTIGSVMSVGLLVGAPAVSLHGPTGLLLGLIAGLFYAVGERSTTRQPRRLRWSWPAARAALKVALAVGLIFGSAVGLSYELVGGIVEHPHQRLFASLFYGSLAGLLVWLASGLDTEPSGAPRAVSARERMGRSAKVALIVGLLVAVVSGLMVWLSFGLPAGWEHARFFGPFAAMYAGVSYGLGERSRTIQPAARLRWLWSAARLRTTLVVGLLAWLFTGQIVGLMAALPAGLLGALLTALCVGLSTRQLDETRADPNERISRSARSALLIGLFVALFVGRFNVLADEPGDGLLAGLLGGVLAWLFFGGMAHVKYLLLRAIFARADFAPWQYVRFLDYAAERLFLRKVGSGYIFMHRLLLEYFASLPETSPASGRVQSSDTGRGPYLDSSSSQSSNSL